MNYILFALLPVGSLVSHAVVAAVAIVGTYLFLRNNKEKKAKIDAFVDQVKKDNQL